jgi:hypothetical protein
MDPKEFKQRLEQFAELEVIKSRALPQRSPEETITVWRDGEQVAIEDDNNPTLTYKVKALKQKKQACVDCGKSVLNRVVVKKLLTFPIKHWRNHCNNCNSTQDPRTGEYRLKGSASNNAWTQFLKANLHTDQIDLNQSDLTMAEKKPTK